MFYPFFDGTSLLLIPAIILAIYSQFKVSSSFSRYSKISSSSNLRAVEATSLFLEQNGLESIDIFPVQGSLTDHYDPINKRLGLSQSVYNSTSIAALAVAAHEVGHAIQHKQQYIPLTLRNSIFPIASFGSSASWFLLLIGFLIHSTMWIKLGIFLFSFAVFFHVITLPVEFDASSRGLKLLKDNNILTQNEIEMAKKVLFAAALTYVAGALMSVLQLLRLLMLSNNDE